MLFNSDTYLIFFLAVFILYYLFSRNTHAQNSIILISSCVFYGYWSIKFLFLMLLSAIVDYFVAKNIYKSRSKLRRRSLLLLSVLYNCGVLFIFKYYNFFSEEFVAFMGVFGFTFTQLFIDVILPVGISFYTFQTMGYSIDVYRKKIKPENNFLVYSSFVTFFPQLVAGPIERGKNILPQLRHCRNISIVQCKEAFWLLCWGYFLKVFVADSAAPYVDFAFVNTQDNGYITIIATFMFGLQIYADFFGYSLIALGCAKLLGINISWNFSAPYLALSIQDFWKRWHITLGKWFKDYVYIPIGGNRHGHIRTFLNLMFVMSLVGVWHGANWNFIIWGVFHGFALAWQVTYNNLNKDRIVSPVWQLISWFATILIVHVGWFVFRIQDLEIFLAMTNSLTHYYWDSGCYKILIAFISLATPTIFIDIINKRKHDQLYISKLGKVKFSFICGIMLFLVVVFFNQDNKEFIYFQF